MRNDYKLRGFPYLNRISHIGVDSTINNEFINTWPNPPQLFLSVSFSYVTPFILSRTQDKGDEIFFLCALESRLEKSVWKNILGKEVGGIDENPTILPAERG